MKPLLLSLFLFTGSLSMAQTKAQTVCFKETTDKKDIRKQINYYRNQIKQNPTDDVAYNGLGMCYYRLFEFKNAIAVYDTLIKMNPKYDGAYANRGICKLFSKDKDGAGQDFKSSVSYGKDPAIMDGKTLSEYIKKNCAN